MIKPNSLVPIIEASIQTLILHFNNEDNNEWEKEITTQEAEELLQLCLPGVIDKTRYEIKIEQHIWEIDIFHGENNGLNLAEIELQSETETFSKPDCSSISAKLRPLFSP